MKRPRIIILVSLFLLLEASYVIGTWVFLNKGQLLSLLNSNPDSLLISYEEAYSLFPGSVHLKGIHFRIQDPNIQLYFELDSATVSVGLLPLRGERFIVKSLTGHGLDFRLRFRRDVKDLRPHLADELPSIPGFAEFHKHPEPPGQPGPWRVLLAGVSISDIHDVWLDTVRFKGHASVNGGFELRPGRGAGVFPARLSVDSGEITIRGDDAAYIEKGLVEGRIDSFEKDAADGLKLFQYVSGEASFKGRVNSVHFLNHYVQKMEWLKFEGGGGPIQVDVKLEKGKLQPGSFFHVDSPHITVNLWDQQARGEGVVSWKVEKEKGLSVGNLGVRFLNFNLEHRSSEETESEAATAPRPTPRIGGKDLDVAISTSQLNLTDPFSPRTIHILLPDAHVSDFSYFNVYLPANSGFRMVGGEGTFRGEISASKFGDWDDNGTFTVEGKQAIAHFDDFQIQGAVKAKVLLTRGNIEKGTFDVSGSSADISDVLVSPEGKSPDPGYKNWWGKIQVTEGTVAFREPAGSRCRAVHHGP